MHFKGYLCEGDSMSDDLVDAARARHESTRPGTWSAEFTNAPDGIVVLRRGDEVVARNFTEWADAEAVAAAHNALPELLAHSAALASTQHRLSEMRSTIGSATRHDALCSRVVSDGGADCDCWIALVTGWLDYVASSHATRVAAGVQ